MLIYLIFFWFLIQYIYLQFSQTNIGHVSKTIYKYEIQQKQREATIYKINPRSDKIILFISGDYNLGFHSYIRKTMRDLITYKFPLVENYELICYENYKVSSIIIYDDVEIFINSLHEEIPITDLIMIGFSAGGVVCSHIMSRLHNIVCRKKIITYDTPWQVRENVEHFTKNTLYRPDILFYKKVYNTYLTHYNADEIKEHLCGTKWCNGACEMVEMIKKIHDYDDETMNSITGFNLDQCSDLIVVNLYCNYDPLVDRNTHNMYYEKIKEKVGFHNVFIMKNVYGHCSDMCFSINYLDELEYAIKYDVGLLEPSYIE